MRRLIGCAVAVVLFVCSTLPLSVGEIWTFYTGESYLNAPEPSRTLYVAGLSDTLNALTDSGDIDATWVVTCTKGKHSSELTAIEKS